MSSILLQSHGFYTSRGVTKHHGRVEFNCTKHQKSKVCWCVVRRKQTLRCMLPQHEDSSQLRAVTKGTQFTPPVTPREGAIGAPCCGMFRNVYGSTHSFAANDISAMPRVKLDVPKSESPSPSHLTPRKSRTRSPTPSAVSEFRIADDGQRRTARRLPQVRYPLVAMRRQRGRRRKSVPLAQVG